MAILPEVNEDELGLYRGTGKISGQNDYLLNIDQTTYYYEKFKSANNKYLRDDMWTEAAKRGESNILINTINLRNQLDEQTDIDDSKFLDTWNEYNAKGFGDYDTYMLALSIPTLDNSTVKERIDDETGYEFGNYTDRDWAKAVLQSSFDRYNAEIVEQRKADRNWWESFWQTFLAGSASAGTNIVSGFFGGLNDIYNVGEGIVNIFADWGHDDNWGNRFLYAFANDDANPSILKTLEDYWDNVTYRLEYNYTDLVNAVEAYENGYVPNGGSLVGKDWKEDNIGAGYSGFGNFWHGTIKSIGYMLPAILSSNVAGFSGIGAELSGSIGTGLFYTQIFSSNITENIERASLNYTYKQLNAGEVVSNAALKAGAQWAVETILGKVIGFTLSDRLKGLGVGTARSFSGIGETEGKAFLIALKRLGKNMGKEGLEETLQDMSDSFIDMLYGMSSSKIANTYLERAGETFTIDNLLQSFLGGALIEGIFSTIGTLKFANQQAFNRVDKDGNLIPMVGEREDGVTYKLGTFQAMNFNEALQNFNSWNEVLQDNNATKEAKRDAALKMSMAMASVGDVFKSFGDKDAIKVNNALVGYAKTMNDKAAIEKMSTVEYAETLYKNFIDEYANVSKKYIDKIQENKIKNAFKRNEKELKDSITTKMTNVITDKINPDDPDIPLSGDKARIFVDKLKALGAEAIVGVDGAIIRKSEDIILVNNTLLQEGRLDEIVTGIAYQQVEEEVRLALSTSQRNMLVQQYSKITGIDVDIEEAIKALLFDKYFYTKMLLLSEERHYQTESLKLLATIDKLVKSKAAENLKNGKLTNDAYNTLMSKVYDTMRTGIINYATNYSRLNLGEISNDILSSDVKELISNNKNVIFSEYVDNSIKEKNALSEERISRYDTYLNKFSDYITPAQRELARQKVRSTKINDRVDAYAFLTQLTKKYGGELTDKIVYLPASSNGILEQQYIKNVEDLFGSDWKSIIEGTYNTVNLTDTIKNFIRAANYDLNDTRSRFACIRELLFNASNKTLTLGINGEVVRIMDKYTLIKDEYLGPNGKKKFRSDLRNGVIKSVSDVIKIEIPKNISSLEIRNNPIMGGARATYADGNKYITLSNEADVNNLLHELTHATQYITKAGKESILGGTLSTFTNLQESTSEDLIKYLSENFGLSYDYLMSKANVTPPDIMYFLLGGELQANSTLSNHMFDVGFTWRDNRSILVSPDGKKTWSMKTSYAKQTKADKTTYAKQTQDIKAQMAAQVLKQKSKIKKLDATQLSLFDTINEDRILTDIEEEALADNPELKDKLKNSIFKTEDNKPLLFWRGSKKGLELASDARKSVFLSSKPFIGTDYAATEGTLKGYAANFTENEVYVVDAKNKSWNNIPLNEELSEYIQIKDRFKVSIDILEDQIFRLHPEIKALYVKNIVEDPGETFNEKTQNYIGGNDLIVRQDSTDKLIKVSMEDNDTFSKYWGIYKQYNTDGFDTEDSYNKFVTEYKDWLKESSINEERDLTDKQKEAERKYYKARHISNKIAKDSNLKYFIKKGVPIQMDPNVAKFIVSTTNDFNKLPIVLKDKITEGSLTRFDIADYVATAANMDDYTFKAIAKYIYKNDALAKITFKDMLNLQSKITDLAATAYILSDKEIHKQMTPAQILEEYNKLIKSDTLDANQWAKAEKYATHVVVTGKKQEDYPEAFADPSQLNPMFFHHYDGTLKSLRNINTLGKTLALNQQDLELIENVETGEIKGTGGVWNYTERKKKADVKYEYGESKKINLNASDLSKTLDSIDRVEKINLISAQLAEIVGSRALQKIEQGVKINMDNVKQELAKRIDALNDLSDEELNRKYLNALQNESITTHKIEGISTKVDRTVEYKDQVASTKNLKDNLRNSVNKKDGLRQSANNLQYTLDNLSRYMPKATRTKLEQIKVSDFIPTEVSKYLDENYKLKTDYRTLSDNELKELTKEIQLATKKIKSKLQQIVGEQERIASLEEKTKRLAAKQAATSAKLKQTKEELKNAKTLKEKLKYKYRTTIRTQKFEFITNIEPNKTVRDLLDTSWDKTRFSTVKGLTNNKEENIANGKQFFKQNAKTLLSSDLSDVDYTVRWFLNSRMNNATDEEFKKFSAIKMYYLGYVFSETGSGQLYSELNPNLKQQIENYLKNETTIAGTMLTVWKNLQGLIDPLHSMKNADIELDGISIKDEQKDILFNAIDSGDIEAIKKAQEEIIQYVESQKTTKRSFLRKAVTVRSMSMLSSPLTWLRNKVSNFAVKRLNKLSDAIGKKLWKGGTTGQLKFTKNVTPEIQNYITKNFVDNKFFDSFVSNLSKYNPSDIEDNLRSQNGEIRKEAIIAKFVLKSMYNEYYNKNQFDHKFMNDLHNKLMKLMSDDAYVKEASLRYFGKMLAEKVYDLSTNEVSDEIMNDFATAVGLAMKDYMHSDNFFNNFEKIIAEKSDLGWFAYKTLLPFASSSWNWFKAAVKLSPVGLAKAIRDTVKLEDRIAKAQVAWDAGKSQVSPELTEYIVKRDLGQGVIGTVLWGLGALLAGLGYIKLDEDDYGTPKLHIGNLTIDVSSIFGSSSVLAGAALITGIKDEKSFLEGMDRMVNVMLEDMPFMQIVEMDMYSNGGFSMGMDQLESIATSYIPNILGWLAGATYSGTVKKDKFWQRAIAKIPFMANLLEKNVDPYTGKKGSYIDALNRIIPYFSLDTASQNERKTTALGLNKSQLRGSYQINNETFTVTGKDLTMINEAYGIWNAEDLTKFYNNQMKVKVQISETKYGTLTYNQMNDIQRKNAVQTIMSNNAELAKILAWTNAGNKYYGSINSYIKLLNRGYSKNIYKGTKGFVKSK